MQAAPAASWEYVFALRDRLLAARRGSRRALVEEAAERIGLSAPTMYRRLAECGWTSDRKPRADRGTSCVDAELARTAAGMVATARRANGKKTLPLTTARDILEANGQGCKINVETGEVSMPSAATLSRVMYRHGCHPEQLKHGKTPVELRSLHPNHAWQIDASVCVLFYLPGGEVQVFDEKKFYKNKMENLIAAAPERVIRWVITDHYSGAFFLRYTLGAEDADNMAAVLIEAMCRRDAGENDCLYGVPGILMLDKGSGGRSAQAKNLFGGLGIRAIPHAKGNPRAKGQVEQAQNLIETHFEGRLRMYSVGSLADLNASADSWRIMYNLTKLHTRHGRTRHSKWRTITEDQLRVPASAEVLREFVCTGIKRVRAPKNLILSYPIKGFGRMDYDLRYLHGILPRMEIDVQVNVYRAPCLDVTLEADGERRAYTLTPIRRDEGGFRLDAPVIGDAYKAAPDTLTDKALKQIHKEAYGAATAKEAEEARAGKRPAYAESGIDPMADVKAMPQRAYMPTRGREFTPERPQREAQPLTIAGAAMRLKRALAESGVAWTEAHMEHLVRAYPDGLVPEEDLQNLARQMLPAKVTQFEAAPARAACGAA